MVWILLTLATNSMAQPSGRISGASSRYRIYLCSSPFFCLADGLAILTRMFVTSMHLRISPLKASRLAIISRGDERHHSLRNKDTCFDDNRATSEKEGPPPVTAAAWPRWLFFLVGTVPAAIQLASFSGVVVAQTLGLMFVSSFAVIELVTFLSTFEEGNTISQILGYLKVEGVTIEEEPLRFKTYKLFVRLEWCDTAFFGLALIAQSVLMFELFHQIWVPATVHLSKVFEYTFMKVLYAIVGTFWLLLQVVLVVRFVLWLAGVWQSLNHWLPLRRCALYWFSVTFLMGVIPYKPLSLLEDKGFKNKLLTFSGSLIYFGVFYWGVAWLCERRPSVARGFLFDRTPWDLAKIEHLPPRHRTGFEEMTGVIQPFAWFSFCIFLSNLGVCILWYAFIYDSTGTLNPSWTDVFG
jgi:hypothetical protein